MKLSIFLTFVYLFRIASSQLDDENDHLMENQGSSVQRVSCSNYKLKIPLNICTRGTSEFDIQFAFASARYPRTFEISSDLGESGPLLKDIFNLSKKTLLVLHGFKSSGSVDWVIKIKNAALVTDEYNVILVDWSKGCDFSNYVRAAKNTVKAASKIQVFLEKLRGVFDGQQSEWSKLYIVGHSLGAHVSGQLGYLLKTDSDHFFSVDKISGLDPAGPCFDNATSSDSKLDAQDADFVEAIHTQSTGYISLGSRRPVGNIDFYVNGGLKQPKCANPLAVITRRICSHALAHAYFVESIYNYIDKQCWFEGHVWEGTYLDAKRIVTEFKEDPTPNENNPEMGFGSAKGRNIGRFFVITSATEPYCRVKVDDYSVLKNILEDLRGKDMKFY